MPFHALANRASQPTPTSLRFFGGHRLASFPIGSECEPCCSRLIFHPVFAACAPPKSVRYDQVFASLAQWLWSAPG